MNSKHKSESNSGFDLHDNIVMEVFEQQLEKNLLASIEADRLRDAIVAEEKTKIDKYLFHYPVNTMSFRKGYWEKVRFIRVRL